MIKMASAFIRYTRIPALGFLVMLLFVGASAGADYLTVSFPDGPLPDARVSVLQSGDLLYADLNDFAKALNIRTFFNTERRKLQYTIGSVRLKWSADNAFVVIGDRIYQLPSEVIYDRNRLWAPLDAFLEILTTVYPARIDYERYLWTVTIRPTQFDVYAISYDPKENGTLIRISCLRKLAISGAALRDGRLSLTLMGAKVNRKALEMIPPEGAIKELIIDELPESVQLTFKLSRQVLDHTLWQEENPDQIIISLTTSIVAPDSMVQAESPPGEEVNQLLERDQERWKIDCVVIDPGHGGKDTGAIGVTGLKEKDVVLDVALRLKKLLEKNTDLRVVLTREDDRFIGLSDRTKFANQVGGKLFISIHCNSSKYRSANGFETYFLKPARSERAMEVALLENSVIKYEESKNQYQDLTEENYILLAMAQAEFAKESETMADILQSKMKIHTNLKDRGVDQAGFYVLVGASMPAILFEAPFLSNKREEKLLKTKKFRQKIAQGIYESILEFKKREDQKERGLTTRP